VILRVTDSSRLKVSVAILLATYNGERFIDEQLASIAEQTVARIDLYASDDGSTDGTLARLEAWQRRWDKGRFEISAGPRQGFAENFRRLMQVDRDADYLAFSDQDDIWDPDKLEAAIAQLDRLPEGVKLYVSRTRLVDEAGRPIGFSPLFRRPPDFRNALVQNIGGGNTAVLNPAAAALVAESARRTTFVSHDWWCYLIFTGAGGAVIYDPVPHIGYRQHDNNVVGRNSGWIARLARLRGLMEGRFARWTDLNLQALQACTDLLTAEALALLDIVTSLRSSRGMAAIRAIHSGRIFRQTAAGQTALILAACLGKL
jgi:glycosyltransferase involved in cell wall biosynthesis